DIGQDKVTDFGVGDVVEIRGRGIADFAELQAFISKVNGDTLIAFDEQNTILLEDVELDQLQIDDFRFLG
ncbi:unnamed protein product, partial [Ectocarpus fasciculatus]